MQPKRSRLLRVQEMDRVMNAIPHLYAPCRETDPTEALHDGAMLVAYPTPSTAWTRAIVNALYAAVPGVSASFYNILNPQSGEQELMVTRRIPPRLTAEQKVALRESGMRAIHEDPTYHRARAAIPSGEVFIDSDFQTLRQLESSRAYREFYFPTEVRFQMVFAVPSGVRDRTTFCGVFRWDRPFTERDRCVGQLLQHHIRGAYASRVGRDASAARSLESLDPSALDALGLSPRQTEVFYWLACGKRDSEIATILGTSRRTINHHVAAIYQKLGVETRAAAIKLALETAMRIAK